MNTKEIDEGKAFYFPTLLVFLVVGLVIMGLITFYGTREQIKDCTGEVTGVVELEGEGRAEIRDVKHTVEGKYLSNGKNGRYWVVIRVKTDGVFKHETLYAGTGYGREGDELTIRYDPEDPDEYYIGDGFSLNSYWAAVVFFVLAGIMFALTIYATIYFNVKKEESEEEREQKLAEKLQRDAERSRKAKAKVALKMARYTKDYRNPYIREHIQDKVIGSKILLWLLVIGISMCVYCVLKTSVNMYLTQSMTLRYYFDHLWGEMKDNMSFVAFIFGLTFIIIVVLMHSEWVYAIRFFRPTFSGRKYLPEEIDRLANDIDTVPIKNLDVLVTPKALIGLNCGLAVVDYSDIYGIRQTEERHRSKYRKWYTYRIYIETKKHKKILLCESEDKFSRNKVTRYLNEKFVEYQVLDK